eukprot:1604103-Rhodomonas_salina.3
MVLWYLRHLLHNDYELPPIIIGTARFLPPDAPTTPPVVLTSCFVLPGDIRAHNYDQGGYPYKCEDDAPTNNLKNACVPVPDRYLTVLMLGTSTPHGSYAQGLQRGAYAVPIRVGLARTSHSPPHNPTMDHPRTKKTIPVRAVVRTGVTMLVSDAGMATRVAYPDIVQLDYAWSLSSLPTRICITIPTRICVAIPMSTFNAIRVAA